MKHSGEDTTEQTVESICLNREQYSVYSCVCYFNIFSYPLKPEEICSFIDLRLPLSMVQEILQELKELNLVFENHGFFSLEKESGAYLKKRSDSEKRFLRNQKTIRRFASFISRFPYVESVSISGSCSKGLLEEEGDVDYFVITTPKKLWLCRTMLMLFKKIFLLNSKKYFCLNYFVDAETLEIPDQNLFVASEIKTLIPISNRGLFEKFLKANEWTSKYLPNKVDYNHSFLKDPRPRNIISRGIEAVLNNGLGSKLDNFCFRLTLSTWKNRFNYLGQEDFNLNFRSKKNVSKHHPRGFQKKVLFEMGQKLERIKVMG